MIVEFSYVLHHEGNARGHWRSKNRRTKDTREMVRAHLWQFGTRRPPIPCAVLLTYFSPIKMDDDNIRAAFKAVRDEIASWLGVDDRDSHIVRYAYDWRQTKRNAPDLQRNRIRVEFSDMTQARDLLDLYTKCSGSIELRTAYGVFVDLLMQQGVALAHLRSLHADKAMLDRLVKNMMATEAVAVEYMQSLIAEHEQRKTQ